MDCFHSPKLELLGCRYSQESNRKNNVCQGINVTEQIDNIGTDGSFAGVRRLEIGPFVNDVVYEIDNKSNADQEIRMTQQITVIVGDHEIDLVNAEKHD